MDAYKEHKFQKNFRYHHGNLRSTLIEAALEILQTEGIEALSLRRVARASFVSQAAPYSHFRDKNDLMAAIAETGFQKLAMTMADDAAGIKSSRAQIEKLIESYIRFAAENKALFQLMFSRELSNMKEYPTLAMTAGKSYSLISTALSKRQNQAQDTRFLTVAIWSLCHGLTSLVIDGKVNIEQFDCKTTDEFVKKIVGIFATDIS